MRDIWFMESTIVRIKELAGCDKELAELTYAYWFLTRCDCSIEQVFQDTKQKLWHQRQALAKASAVHHPEVL